MPRSRRRPIRSAAKRSRSRTVVVVVVVAVLVALVIASFAEITAQSAGYRASTNAGYGALAARVVDASNRTGSELAQLMTGAPTLANGPVPRTARAQLQQGLDAAVTATADEVAQSRQLVPPYPSDDVSVQFTRVMSERAGAAVELRSAIDGLLGLAPVPVASGSAPSESSTELQTKKQESEALASVPTTAAAMSAAGRRFEGSDGLYRVLRAGIRQHRLNIRLPASVWVPSPLATAPLGQAALGQAATALADSQPLQAVHRLVITAAGLNPPAVVAGSPSAVGVGCEQTTSTVPGPNPTVLPPTSSVGAAVTVTNCGTVPETGVLTETLALADPPGTALPARHARGGSARVTVSVASGASRALTMAPMAVAGGHLYLLTLSIAIPTDQIYPQGTSQQFLLKISP